MMLLYLIIHVLGTQSLLDEVMQNTSKENKTIPFQMTKCFLFNNILNITLFTVNHSVTVFNEMRG